MIMETILHVYLNLISDPARNIFYKQRLCLGAFWQLSSLIPLLNNPNFIRFVSKAVEPRRLTCSMKTARE